MSTHVYVDFDGTIMSCDTTDVLLERFALPAWRDVEAEWASGNIGSKACMARQVDLLRATPEQLDLAVAGLAMTPGFASFAAACRLRGIGLTIVSDGLDRVIEATLRRCGLDLPYFANQLVPCGTDRWRLEFPNSHPDCVAQAGHCKCARTLGRSEHFKVVIGDSRSDFCIAGRADLVLAKASLLTECRAKGMPHHSFEDFHQALDLLTGWLVAGPTRRPASEPQLLRV